MIVKIRLEDLPKKMRQIQEKIPTAGRAICKQIATDITHEMKAAVPYWHGTLYDSISTKTVGENTFAVTMADYGVEVEEGHPVTSISPLLWDWIADITDANPTGMLNISNWMLDHGAAAHPFSQRAIWLVEMHIPKIIKNYDIASRIVR